MTIPMAHTGLVGAVFISPKQEKALLTYRASGGPQKGVALAVGTN